jgi:NADPH-dependent F420 reductase
MQLGFWGGTGTEGSGLAMRFAQAGARALIGSRSLERAQAAAQRCNQILGAALVEGAENPALLERCEVVFLTLPADKAVAAVSAANNLLRPGLILVDVTAPVAFRDGRVEYLQPDAGSNSEAIAARLPRGVELAAAFKTVPAHLLSNLTSPLECDVFVCGDSKAAKEKVIALAGLIPSLRVLDAGGLRTAQILERMTVLAIELNRRYKSKEARFRIVGVHP